MENTQNNTKEQQTTLKLISDIIFLNSIPLLIFFVVSAILNWFGISIVQNLLSEKWILIMSIVIWIYFLFSIIYLIFRKYKIKVIIFSLIQVSLMLTLEMFIITLLSLWITNLNSSIERNTQTINNLTIINKNLKKYKIKIQNLEKKLESCQVNTWTTIETKNK